jgi:DNA-binding MarR family transcriptional regulator
VTRTPHPPAAALDEELVGRLRFSVTRLARLLRQQDETGLTPTSVAMLATIGRDGPLTLGELAAHEQVAPPTITKVIGKLEDAGLVDRVPDPIDRRVCRVVLTDHGHQQLDVNRSRRTAWLGDRLASLPPEEAARLDDLVDMLEHLINPGGEA